MTSHLLRLLSQLSRRCGLGLLAAGMLMATAVPAWAVPSFARQTGAECAACHVGAYGPQLTPYGIKFKLGGYNDSNGKSNGIPLSGMAVGNWTRTSADLPQAPDHFKSNNNAAIQEVSAFLAGKLYDNVGSFVQVTYSGIEHKTALDQFDLRYAKTLQLGDKEALVGASLNGNPTLTDPFNTLGQWRFPYTASDFGFGNGPAPVVESLGGGVIGANAYALWDGHYYGELGLYNSLSDLAVRRLGGSDVGKFKGPGRYWRLGYMSDRKRDFFSVGLVGFDVAVQPDRTQLGVADRYKDVGLDASYQFLGNRRHIVTLNSSYIIEHQRLDFSDAGLKQTLKTFNAGLSYHYDQTWGASIGRFDARGIDDTAGTLLQADWTPWGKETSWGAPWANVRLGLQYAAYQKFNGGSTYLDDTGALRRARDNNTLSMFVWTSF